MELPTQENIYSQVPKETFPKLDHMLAIKTSLNKLKKSQAMHSTFSHYNRIQLELSRKFLVKFPSTLKLSNVLLTTQTNEKRN